MGEPIVLETKGTEQQEPPQGWRDQFRGKDEITMYLYIAGLIRVLRSNTVRVLVAQAMYRRLGHAPRLPRKRHWYSRRVTQLTWLDPKYSFADVMAVVDGFVSDLPTADWPNKIDMIRAWPAIHELIRHVPNYHKPPEYDLQVRTAGRGENYMLSKLRTAFNESFPPGVRL